MHWYVRVTSLFKTAVLYLKWVQKLEDRGLLNTLTKCICFVGLISRVNTALGTLRRARAGMIAERRREGVLAVRNEMSAAFTRKRGSGGVKKPSKGLSRAVWKHRFVCLAHYGQTKVPTTEYEKSELFEAGLGEKEVKFSEIDISATQFRDVL